MHPYSSLTRDLLKQQYYAADPYMRVALAEIEEFGLVSADLTTHASILFKPDAIARRLVGPALILLAENGFMPIDAHAVMLDGPRSNALWWYQWNRASSDRLRLAELFGRQSPSLLVLMRADPSAVPATVQLSGMKGSADRKLRSQEHLRTKLGMRNRMLSLIHCPDEPADLLRDLAILLSPRRRKAVWQSFRGDNISYADPNAIATELYAAHSFHDLDPMAACQRRALESTILRTTQSLSSFEARFGAITALEDTWDFITIAAEVIEHHVDHVAPLLSSMDHKAQFAAWSD